MPSHSNNSTKAFFTLLTLSCLLSLFVANTLFASGGARYRTGTIAAKGTVLSEEGNPFFVEYDEQGEVVTIIGEEKDDLEGAQIMPATTFRFYAAAFQTVEDQHAAHREILTAAQYKTKTSFTNAAGEVFYDKPPLQPATRSVVIRTPEVLFSNNELILHESPLNLLQQPLTIPNDVGVLLLNKVGEIKHMAEVDIGYRVAYFTGDEYGTSNDSISMYEGGNQGLGGYRRSKKHKLWGPMAGVEVESGLGRRKSYSDENGFYSANHFLCPCPGFSWRYDNFISATFKYQAFNPNSKQIKSFYSLV